ncbi:MAG: acetyltransferase [Planctomycetes bacterium]|nr:acetyltransferase [Planctomycetota bacterium]
MTEASDFRERFKSCGRDVSVAPDAYFEHPEVVEVGDGVTFMRGFHMLGSPKLCRIGSRVSFYPHCFIQGSAGRFVIGEHVEFFPGTYISLGDWDTSFVEIGHHCHFAPNCVLYGWGGLTISPYCNIAAHTVFATVGHHEEITDRPMALTGEKAGPITLEEDVWVAANVTITANTRIARGCVIGANAVVTRDTEPMGLYVGVPARRLRERGAV